MNDVVRAAATLVSAAVWILGSALFSKYQNRLLSEAPAEWHAIPEFCERVAVARKRGARSVLTSWPTFAVTAVAAAGFVWAQHHRTHVPLAAIPAVAALVTLLERFHAQKGATEAFLSDHGLRRPPTRLRVRVTYWLLQSLALLGWWYLAYLLATQLA